MLMFAIGFFVGAPVWISACLGCYAMLCYWGGQDLDLIKHR